MDRTYEDLVSRANAGIVLHIFSMAPVPKQFWGACITAYISLRLC